MKNKQLPYSFKNNLPNISVSSSLYVRSKKATSNIRLAKKIINYELGKYPELVIASKLSFINLVSDLRVKNNERIDKFVPLSATPDNESRWLYFDTTYLRNEKYFRECVNHEFWHFFDFALHDTYVAKDEEWEKLNPSGFKYGQGGWTAYHTDYKEEFHPRDGFVTKYSTLGIDEDHAEIFMYMYTDHLRPQLEQLRIEDKILDNKVALTEKRLREWTDYVRKKLNL